MEISQLTGLAGTTAATRDKATLGEQFDGFLTLLTTQLQNQDPLSPLDANEFTAQLVQFTSVEQTIRTNQHLEQLISLARQNESARALDYLGLTVEATSERLRLDGEGDVVISFDLPGDAANGSVTITDLQGGAVRNLPISPEAGLQSIVWDGLNSFGDRATSGLYRIAIQAVDSKNAPLAVASRLQGMVDAIEFQDGSLNLSIGGVPLPYASVTRVLDMSPASAG